MKTEMQFRQFYTKGGSMIARNRKQRGAILGGLVVSVPITLLTATSALAFPLNPCPAIYYEEPFNTTHAVPAGCPPNAATQRLIQEGRVAPSPTPAPTAPIPGATFPATPDATPPLPETVRPLITTVTPTAGQVSVQLVNETGTIVTYQAIGFTEQRVLQAGESITLRGLETPVTMTMVRNDGGFIRVMPMAASEAGLLSISLNRAADLGQNQRTLNIQPSGQVFAY
jgi:hypothetical protein